MVQKEMSNDGFRYGCDLIFGLALPTRRYEKRT
jgi:hypothetical protein